MNDATSDPAPSTPPPPPPAPDRPRPFDWMYWAKRLLLCNPFFLCSAALLLFGVNRLSNDEKLFAAELSNLLFNFSALQCYGVLVVVTALVLARRRVWYDSALLVVLEHGLVLVPFMLLSQAVVQGEAAREGLRLAWMLSLAGGAVAVARMGAVRRWYPQFNLPPRALLLGALILAGNVALPLVFRPRMEQDVADWREENLFLWLVALPLLAAGANLLRRPIRYSGLNPERSWLPLFLYALWVTGSAVHVWCVAHICSLPLQLFHLAPLAWVAAWTLWNRLSDCACHPSPRWQEAVLGLTFAAPFLAFQESRLFVALAGANLLAYGILLWRSTDNWPLRPAVKHLTLATLAVMAAGMPEEWGRALVTGFNRPRGVVLGCAGFALLQAMRSRRPEVGLAGALAIGIGLIGAVNPRAPQFSYHVIVQASLVFLLLHSLRWRDAIHPGAASVRWMAALGWAADALWWTQSLRWPEAMGTAGLALGVAAAWVLAWWLQHQRGPLAIPVAAALTLWAAPINWLFRHGSDGVLALLGSLALFAVGTVLAWTRHRWERRNHPEGG